ncbi:DUF4124 domain-containing protein [Massilia sp. B-10]|nr:DUF4124 domain-containing protein [Massilia sp. B-10]UUZ52299.1 DUF4124 domain-containing protein [Massilia sp. H-1]
MLASGVLAQQMYKVVGADGKITYSDRPAYEKANKLSVMKSYTLRPVESAKLSRRQTGRGGSTCRSERHHHA